MCEHKNCCCEHHHKPLPGTDGDKYIPYSERKGDESTVYFTRDLSANGLLRIFDRLSNRLHGKVAVKIHTGERNGPNLVPTGWVKALFDERLDENASIVETNTYYEGDRHTEETHRELLKVNGWTFCPVDILDGDGGEMWEVKNGKWFKEISIGGHLKNYDSFVNLTHFKGHTAGGFGGCNKNIGIGCADGLVGKAMIHSTPGQDDMWDIAKEEFMERMCESTKAVTDHFVDSIIHINVMRNMSVSCDCEGIYAAPVVTPNVGILASVDILAADQASVDMIYAMKEEYRHHLVERFETRHGLRQLSYMKEIGMGNDKYTLIDIDNNDTVIDAAKAVEHCVPFEN